jgi:hypothetical protein
VGRACLVAEIVADACKAILVCPQVIDGNVLDIAKTARQTFVQWLEKPITPDRDDIRKREAAKLRQLKG